MHPLYQSSIIAGNFSYARKPGFEEWNEDVMYVRVNAQQAVHYFKRATVEPKNHLTFKGMRLKTYNAVHGVH